MQLDQLKRREFITLLGARSEFDLSLWRSAVITRFTSAQSKLTKSWPRHPN